MSAARSLSSMAGAVPQPAAPTSSLGATFADFAIGGVIGALGGSQGLALPGVLVLGLGFDLVAAATYTARPDWFPERDGITARDIVTTAVGTFAGWLIGRAFGSWASTALGNPAGAPTTAGAAPAGGAPMRTLAAGLAVGAVPLALGAIPGRMPGGLRRASYRYSR